MPPALDALLAHPGVEEHLVLAGRVGVLALHGGLEAGTFEIAQAVCRRSGASLYAVRQPADLRWHVPSVRYAPEHSERLTRFLAHVDVAVSLHGYGGLVGSESRWLTILLGGDPDHAAAVAPLLRGALPDYVIVDDPAAIPQQYRGVHRDNPVNRTRRGGVQIELPPRVRGNSPIWHDAPRSPDGFVTHTEALVDALVTFTRTHS